jgi:bifunctional non-homologous end joining protein LigD
MRFTVSTAAALLKRKTGWEDYDASERSLETAIRKLTGEK